MIIETRKRAKVVMATVGKIYIQTIMIWNWILLVTGTINMNLV